jgi:hypothetical protein
MTDFMGQKPIVHFSRGIHRFEVFQHLLGREVSYIGYIDGKPSVAAHERHVVTRMLLNRHNTTSRLLGS